MSVSLEPVPVQPAFSSWSAAGFGAELVRVSPSDSTGPSPGKKPLDGSWESLDVTPALLAGWGRQHVNVGLRTRLFPAADIDVDDQAVADVCQHVLAGALGMTACRTRKNSARRALLFRLSGEPFKKRVLKFKTPSGAFAKVEVLADGQQLVVAGTHSSGVPLEWAPQPTAAALPAVTLDKVDAALMLLKAHLNAMGCEFEAPKNGTTPPRPRTSSDDWDSVAEMVEEGLSRLDPDCSYEDWLAIGMALHAKDQGDRGFYAWDRWSSAGDKYPGEEELAKKWKSFKPGPVHFGTFIAMSGVSPSTRHSKVPTKGGAAAQTTPSIREEGGVATPPSTIPEPPPDIEEPSDPYPPALCTGAELFAATFAPFEYAVAPYVPLREFTEVSGPHATFKSTITLYIAFSVATGRPWGGVPVKKGRSGFITLEDQGIVLQARMLAWLEGIEDQDEREQAREDLRVNFGWLAREKARPFILTISDERRRNWAPARATVERLKRFAAGLTVLSLETAARLHPGQEDHEGLGALAAAAEEISTDSGSGVLIGRHHTKAAAREGNADSLSGSGAAVFSNAARSVLSVEQEGRKKPANGEEPAPPDEFAPVHLRQTKPPPLARRGKELVWKPREVETPLGKIVYLDDMTDGDQLREASLKLLRYLASEGPLSKDALHAGPCGMSRHLAKAAMEHLKQQGRVKLDTVDAGKPGRKPLVWVLS
ncbi:MAG TPA: PriCT-2 domain-containing protein [Anaeromyxobacteraceae bacterium]|nr:PriCT-2 domain-containing protein [Anaeromyxobacteraceae bacterium]